MSTLEAANQKAEATIRDLNKKREKAIKEMTAMETRIEKQKAIIQNYTANQLNKTPE